MCYTIMFILFQAEDGIRNWSVTGVQTCALLISSRRRHTRLVSDWSSDVCSSDLYKTRSPVRSSSDNAASGDCDPDRVPVNCPGGGAKGNIIARHTAEWLKPKECPSSCVRIDARSYAFGFDARAVGVANFVTASVGRSSTSASRSWPSNVEGSVLAESCSPAVSADTTRVNARTPMANAGSFWLRQIEFNPSEEVQAVGDDVRWRVPRVAGLSELPGTPVQDASDC